MEKRLDGREIARRAALAAKAAGLGEEQTAALAERSVAKKTVTFDQARTLMGLRPAEAAAACAALEGAGLLAPEKGAKRVPGPGAWSRYRFAFPVPSPRGLRALDLRITEGNQSLLAGRPWLYADHKAKLDALSAWLRGKGGEVALVSEGERAYEIWGDEKELSSASKHPDGFARLLKELRFDAARHLHVYPTAKRAFLSYVLPDRGAVVVSENLDFYVALKALLMQGRVSMLGRRVSGAVLGSGKAVEGADFQAFLAEEGIGGRSLLYVGDVDPEGVHIAQRFVAQNAGAAEMFWPLYERMALLHAERRRAGARLFRYPEDQSAGYDEEAFVAGLCGEAGREARRCLAEHVRIPQEIVSAAVLRGLCDGR